MIVKRLFILLLILIGSLCLPATQVQGAFTVTSLSMNTILHFGSGFLKDYEGFNGTGQQAVNLKNTTNTLSVLGVSFQSVGQTMEQMDPGADPANMDEDSSLEASVIGQALCYPNPFRQTTGGQLGYRLNKNTDVQIQVYDMLANMLIKRDFKSGSKGAQKGYNKVQVNLDTWDGYVLSAGVYFYYIIHEGKVLSKGKMAVIP